MPVNTVPQGDDPRTKLIEIAARLTDREEQNSPSGYWLKTFRKNYRHMAVTYGITFDIPGLAKAETATDATLDRKAEQAA